MSTQNIVVKPQQQNVVVRPNVQEIAVTYGPRGLPGKDGVTDYNQLTNRPNVALVPQLTTTRPYPMVATIGDSITANNAPYLTAYCRLGPAMAGDRLADWWASGVGGYTLAQIQTNLLPNVLALNPLPGHCLIAGGTNDTTAGSVATATATLRQMCDTLVGKGITPILWAPPPRGSSATADYHTTVATLAAVVRQIGAVNRWEVLDAHALLGNASGNLSASYDSGDGVHPNYAGHVVLARAYADIIRRLYPKPIGGWLVSPYDPALTASVGRFIADADANGVADGLTTFSGPTASLVAGAPSGQWQRMSVASGATVNAGINIETTGIIPGRTYEMMVVVEANLSACGEAFAGGMDSNYRSSTAAIGNFTTSGLHTIPSQLRMTASTDRAYWRGVSVAPAGADRIRSAIFMNGTATGAGYVQIAQYSIRDLTALGVA